METQAEYDTLKQYITANAGRSDKFKIKSLAPGIYDNIFLNINFEYMLGINSIGSFSKIALMLLPLNIFDAKLTGQVCLGADRTMFTQICEAI